MADYADANPPYALPGDDHAPVGDAKRLFDEIEEFFTGSRLIEPDHMSG
jgi:hypothetical protein